MVTRHHFLGLLVTFYAFAFSNAESCKVRLIVVWGEPEDNGSEQVASWDKCKTKCLAEESCLLISQTLTDQNATSAPCRIHRFGNITAVKQLDKTSRKRVGFKKKFDNTVAVCPLSVDPPLFGEPTYTHGYLSKGTFYGFELTLYRREWLFRYYTSTCPSPSKIFLRCRVAVCLQVRWFTEPPYMADQLNASALCREGNGMGLSGNYDDKEYIWIRNETTKAKAVAAGLPEEIIAQDMWIWLDGRSEDRPKEFAMEDDTHGGTSSYMWYTNRPSANKTDYCIYMLYNELYVDDEACNKSERFRGGVCRIRIDNADHA